MSLQHPLTLTKRARWSAYTIEDSAGNPIAHLVHPGEEAGRALVQAANAYAERSGPEWACCGCGNTDQSKFRTIEHRGDPAEPVDYDLECTECGSLDNEESPGAALRRVTTELDTLRAELEALKAQGRAP